jgi:hypothetical protein
MSGLFLVERFPRKAISGFMSSVIFTRSGPGLEGKSASHGVVPPSKRLQQLASVEQPSCPITVYTDGDDNLKKLRRGLSEEDKEILDRLEKLQK